MIRSILFVALFACCGCEAAVGSDAFDSVDVAVDSNDVAVDSDDVAVDSNDVAVDSDDVALDSDDVAVDSDDTTVPRDFGPPVEAALAVALEAALAEHASDVQAPGLAAGVHLPTGEWWEGVTGESCPDARVAIGDRFRLGSITKTWVAAAVLQLVDEGRVDLDASIGDLVTGFDLDPAVTVRRCLNHTTGIFDLSDDPLSVDADFSQPIDPGEIVRQSLARAPLFAPGEGWSYSNTNYFLLGLLVEAVAGAPIAEVLRARFIAPLDLRDTFLEAAEPATTTFICGYVYGTEATHVLDMSWAWAAGAMVSSTGDLCRWAEALWRGGLVSPALRDLMVAPTVLPDGRAIDYGLGTMLERRAGLALVGHNGQTLGFQSELYIDPASGACAAVLANDFGARPEAVGRALWQVLAPALGPE